MKPFVSAMHAWTWYATPTHTHTRAAARLLGRSHNRITDFGLLLHSTVISVFAIVILSIIAGLFRSGHEEFVGSTGDPEDGMAVSGTIFVAVIVYAVRLMPIVTTPLLVRIAMLTCVPGFLGILRPPGPASRPREPPRSHRTMRSIDSIHGRIELGLAYRCIFPFHFVQGPRSFMPLGRRLTCVELAKHCSLERRPLFTVGWFAPGDY